MAEFKYFVVLMPGEDVRRAGYQFQDLGTDLRQRNLAKQKKNSLSGYVPLEYSNLERTNFKVCQSLCACQ